MKGRIHDRQKVLKSLMRNGNIRGTPLGVELFYHSCGIKTWGMIDYLRKVHKIRIKEAKEY